MEERTGFASVVGLCVLWERKASALVGGIPEGTEAVPLALGPEAVASYGSQ